MTLVDLETVLRESDVLSLHTPLTPQTTNLIDRAALAKLKPTAILVNCSRGEIVDLDAVAAALVAGTLGGAAFDVFGVEPLPADDPFRSAPNTVLTPHIGYVAAGVYEVWYREIVENIEAFRRGEPVRVIAAAA